MFNHSKGGGGGLLSYAAGESPTVFTPRRSSSTLFSLIVSLRPRVDLTSHDFSVWVSSCGNPTVLESYGFRVGNKVVLLLLITPNSVSVQVKG